MTDPIPTGEQPARTPRKRVNPVFALVLAIAGALLLFTAGAAEVAKIVGWKLGPCGLDVHGIPWTVWLIGFVFVLPYAGNTELAGRILDKIPSFGSKS